MPVFFSGSDLFYCGVAMMAGAAVLGIITAVVMGLSGKRLQKQLDKEFGKRRH